MSRVRRRRASALLLPSSPSISLPPSPSVPRLNSHRIIIIYRLLQRTRESYENDVASALASGESTLSTGVRRGCILNTLSNWHVSENYVADLLHDYKEVSCLYVAYNQLTHYGKQLEMLIIIFKLKEFFKQKFFF